MRKLRLKKTLAMLLAASMVLSGNVSLAFAENVDIDSAVAVDDVQDNDDIKAADELVETEVVDVIMPSAEDAIESADDVLAAEEQADTKFDDSESENAVSAASENVDDSSVAIVGEVNQDRLYYGIEKAKAVYTTSRQIKVTWKKNKESKKYHVYRLVLSENGVGYKPADSYESVTKASYVDKYIDDGSNEAYGYKIVGCDSGDNELTYFSYVLCAPMITRAQRSSVSDDKMDITMINYPEMSASSNSVDAPYYIDLKCGTKKKSDSFSSAVIDTVSSNVYSDSYKKKAVDVRDFTVTIPSASFGSTYYFKAVASMKICGVSKDLTSEFSSIVGGTVAVRAPKIGVVSENDATEVVLTWEDLSYNREDEGVNGISDVSTLDRLGESDTYNIYASIGGKQFKKLKSVKQSSLTYISANTLPVDSTINQTMPFKTVCYTLTGLKPETDYTFKVAPVKSKKQGAMSEPISVYTELTPVTGLTQEMTNFDSVTISWNAVPGAKKYIIYYTDALGKTVADPYPTSFDHEVKVSIKPDKDGIARYTLKKCKNLNYYGFKVLALGNKTPGETTINEQPDSADNCTYCFTKIAAPTVKVTQKSGKLYFTWKKVKGATGYYILAEKKYYNKITGTVSTNMEYDKEVNSSTVKYNTDVLEVGQPYRFSICATYEGEDVPRNAAYGDVANIAVVEESVAPEVPTIKKVFYNGTETQSRGGKFFIIQKSEKLGDNTEIEYRIYRSKYKSKSFKLVSQNDVKISGGAVVDDSYLADGQKAYYRIYAVANNKTFNNRKESRTYATATYCKPNKVTCKTAEVPIGSSKTVELSFEPKDTTMKEVTEWCIAQESSKNDFKAPISFSSDKATSNYENKYFKVTKGYVYDSDYSAIAVGPYAPKLKIEGKAKGTSYIKAKLANGIEVIIKVSVVEKSSDSGSKKSSSKVIVLDPGHGGADGGASYGSLHESTMALKVSNYTKNYLEDDGYTVYLTRSADVALSPDKSTDLKLRAQYASNKKADVLVSQHFNSGGGNGLECWYPAYTSGLSSSKMSKAKSIAEALLSKTASETGLSNRGAKKKSGDSGDYYAINREAAKLDTIGLIMENGFIDGSSDSSFLSRDDNLKKIAKGNANGIKKAL